jgi:hypothetical protein
MSVKLVKQQTLRQYNVSNAVVSARIEGIVPTGQLKQNLANYISGKKNIAQLIEESKKNYIKSTIR